MTRISFVVACDRRGTIGSKGALPWRLPDDMRHVREVTMGKPLIMGRRTWDSIGRPLSGRTSIVLTRDETFHCDGCLVAHSAEDALALAGDVPEIIVFGGAEIFALFMSRADRIYMTEVDAEVDGDTHFEPAGDWRAIEGAAHPADARHPYAFRFRTLERVRPS